MFFCSNFRVSLSNINDSIHISNQGILSILEESAEMHSASIGYGVNDIPNTRFNMGTIKLEGRNTKKTKIWR